MLYDRQKTLNLRTELTVLVIGVGGIGSWVALDLALSGGVKKLVVVDMDIVEESNLNRTPFRQKDIGEKKSSAIRKLILERRPSVEVVDLDSTFENLELFIFNTYDFDYVVDARDFIPDYSNFPKKLRVVKPSYDGFKVSLFFNPHKSNIPILGAGERRYEFVPSYLVPPQLVAGVVTDLILRDLVPSEPKYMEVEDIRVLYSSLLGG